MFPNEGKFSQERIEHFKLQSEFEELKKKFTQANNPVDVPVLDDDENNCSNEAGNIL